MRSRYKIPHDLIKYYPDHLKTSGYYVGNYKKTDYNIGGRKDTECWDNSEEVDWDKLKIRSLFQHQLWTVAENSAFGDFQAKHYLRIQYSVNITPTC